MSICQLPSFTLHLGGLAIRRSDVTSACEAESVCDGVDIVSLPW